jgi:hypothetical protein
MAAGPRRFNARLSRRKGAHMRTHRRLPWPTLMRALALALLLVIALAPPTARAKAPAQPQGDPIEISGRVAIGLDKVFIKDAKGYILVQGLDLSPFAGRNIQARGLVIRSDQEYRTVRLLEYRIASPDDDSPGAGAAVKPADTRKKKK